jgi:predicted nucleic acid-binding protein
MARTRGQAQAERLILDSGAVIALSRNDERARAYLRRALELDIEVTIPVVVLVETLRGGPKDAPVRRVLNSVGHSEPLTEATGALAGKLLGATKRNDTIDAVIVAEGINAGAARILTTGPDDLADLADGYPDVIIEPLGPPRSRGRRPRS